MTSKVVGLRVAGPEPVAELVGELERLTELARSGELRSLLLCGFCGDGGLVTYVSSSADRWRDLGGLERLRDRVHRLMDGPEC